MGKCNLHTSGAILEGNATVGNVLSGKTFYNTDALEIQTGTMANRGAVSASVAVGGTYTIQAGYHNGSGKVTGPTLSGDAGTGNVLSGKTFYSNSGTKQTGTMTNRGAVSANIYAGGSYTIPVGYHNGSGNVSATLKKVYLFQNGAFKVTPSSNTMNIYNSKLCLGNNKTSCTWDSLDSNAKIFYLIGNTASQDGDVTMSTNQNSISDTNTYGNSVRSFTRILNGTTKLSISGDTRNTGDRRTFQYSEIYYYDVQGAI